MTRAFVHTGLPSRVVFGSGTLAGVREEVDRLGLSRVLVLSTPQQKASAHEVAELLGDACVGVYAEAVMHVPTDVAAAAAAHVRSVEADATLAVGGGSSIGLGKAIALETGLPLVAIPTTYAGSEMTPVWGLTDDSGKRTGRDPKVLPVSVVYDTNLTTSLPVEMSVTSGVNALAHAVEATYAPDGSPITDLMAGASIKALASGIPAIVADPSDAEARSDLLYGAWLAGSCLGATTMSLHHKLCHIIGGSFNLSHAWTHTAVLPHVMAFNLRPGSRGHDIVSTGFGDTDPGGALYRMLDTLGLTRSLADLGMPADGIDRVVTQAVSSPYANPRSVSDDDIRRIVTSAFAGTTPAVFRR
ncbi:maleylacetate reductase [Streptomyces sp. GESEQ-35]|uniref:maleylacetate reductase n=1 Tax=Streptomyces sp. GESEQ-35 TaxID=2812657 RepID=UPI001B32C5C7|nr:maleylacetate reductase [Streptomyces sp. GESEQ-35]